MKTRTLILIAIIVSVITTIVVAIPQVSAAAIVVKAPGCALCTDRAVHPSVTEYTITAEQAKQTRGEADEIRKLMQQIAELTALLNRLKAR